MSSSSGRDALEAALAQVLPCTYSLRGSSPRPMAHKTIALTTELREPLYIPRSSLYTVMHQLGAVRQWPTGGIASQGGSALWRLCLRSTPAPSQLKVQWGQPILPSRVCSGMANTPRRCWVWLRPSVAGGRRAGIAAEDLWRDVAVSLLLP